MNKQPSPTARYGLSTNVLVKRDAERNVIFLMGTGARAQLWVHATTQRAIHQLWFSLTYLLFPDKAQKVTSMAATAMLSAPDPGMTTHFEARRDADTCTYDIVGWIGENVWSFEMTDENARQLWVTLDLLLYPAGWEGASTKHRPRPPG